MKRLLILAALTLFAVQAAPAGPIHWAKRQLKKPVVQAGLTLLAASYAHHKALEYCRAGDVERCSVGYGGGASSDYWGTWDWVSIGVGIAGLPIGHACQNDQPGWKFCDVFYYTSPAYQAVATVHDFTHYRPEDKTNLQLAH